MPVSRPSRRAADKERSRAQILAAATRLFAEHGPEAVTFGDLAREAGISRPLIYFHFKDRNQLFYEAVARANQMLHARFVSAVTGRGKGLDQILAVGRAYQAFFEENPREFALVSCYEAKPARPAKLSPVEEQILFHHAAIMELMTAVLKRGIRDGSLRRNLGDPLKTALCLWAFSHGLLQISATRGCGLEQEHGVKPAALIVFGFDLLQAALKRR
jgi:AcrR family transcriptional regulator